MLSYLSNISVIESQYLVPSTLLWNISYSFGGKQGQERCATNCLHRKGDEAMIKVYSLSTCPWCKKLKQFLDQEGLCYEAVDVDTVQGEVQREALDEVERLAGEQSFPVAVVKGKAVIGYQPDKILEALGDEA